MSVLVIGGAGFVGSAVAREAVRRGGPGSVHVLVHTSPAPDLEGVVVHEGDARRLDLGLGPAADDLAADVEHVVVATGAPTVRGRLDVLRASHVHALRGALGFAARCPRLRSVVVTSSVLAVGAVTGRIASGDVPMRPRHRNFYEVVKYEVERLARESTLPVRVVRLGHVVNSVDDQHRTTAPAGIFELLPALLRGAPLIGRPDTRYWMAPVDFVARVTLAMCDDDSPGSCWAVDPESPTLMRVVDVLNLRHGARVRVLPPRRGIVLASRLLPLGGLGWDDAKHGLPYADASWALDLRCLASLVASGQVEVPGDRGYVERTVAHEVERLATLA